MPANPLRFLICIFYTAISSIFISDRIQASHSCREVSLRHEKQGRELASQLLNQLKYVENDSTIPPQWQGFVQRTRLPPLSSSSSEDDYLQKLSSSDLLKEYSRAIKIDLFYRNWSSGGRLGEARQLYEPIESYIKSGIYSLLQSHPDIQLNLIDLFHGHLIWNERLQDLIVVFHSKEYPEDLEPFKLKQALSVEPTLQTFKSIGSSFAKRNLLWSFKKGELWRLDTGGSSPFATLISSERVMDQEFADQVRRANTLPEHLFGKAIADLNFFVVDGEVNIHVQ